MTFAKLVNTLFPKLKTEASACRRTDAVLDVYIDESIKDAELNNNFNSKQLYLRQFPKLQTTRISQKQLTHNGVI